MAIRILGVEGKKGAIETIDGTGADIRSHPYLYPKMLHFSIEIRLLNPRDASIVKQEMLSKGGDAAISLSAYNLKGDSGNVVLTGSLKCYRETIKKLDSQPVKRLRNLAEELEVGLKNYAHDPEFRAGGREFKKPAIMGILNITPDSFSDGGFYENVDNALERAVQMENEGAEIIDIGGQSTRPGSLPISIEEERRRINPVLRAILDNADINIPISVDTTKREIAEEALGMGAAIINDQEGLQGETRDNERFGRLIGDYGASVIIMHNRKTEVMWDVLDFLEKGVETAERCGIDASRVSIDPGIGFGKSVEQNICTIADLRELKVLGRAVTVGASRKSFIGKTIGGAVNERLEGSLAILVYAIANGAKMVRVHDVKESVLAARMAEAIMSKRR